MNDPDVYFRALVRGLRAFDILAMFLCFIAAAIVTSPDIEILGITEFLDIRLEAGNVIVFAFIVVTWGILLSSAGLYAHVDSKRLSKQVLGVLQAVTLGCVFVSVAGAIFDIGIVTFPFIMVFWVAAVAAGSLLRLLVSFALHQYRRRSRHPVEFIIVGINPRSLRLAESAIADSKVPRKFLGFVDVESSARTDKQLEELGAKFLSDLANLPEYLRKAPVDEVLVCLPLKSFYDETMEIVSSCEEQGITVRVLADLFQTRMTHSRVGEIGTQSLITVATHNIQGAPATVKRALDVIVSAALLLFLSPLMLGTAILITLTSPGPAIFRQERVGLNRKIFSVLKFRTMVVDAEVRQAALESLNEAQGPAFKMHNDPRVTGLGRILRKTSIDELPQLFNVLKGDMSLVGPRPLPLRDYAGFEEDWHRRRLSVKPGITGLWQVKDRDHDSFERWMKLDMLYIDQWSLWGDVKIMLETIPAVLRGSGE